MQHLNFFLSLGNVGVIFMYRSECVAEIGTCSGLSD